VRKEERVSEEREKKAKATHLKEAPAGFGLPFVGMFP
jgi:hypothetical protein